MTMGPLQFLVPQGLALGTVKQCLAGMHRLQPEANSALTRTYYDSFDWRLYQAGLALELETTRGSTRLLLRQLEGGEVCATLPLSEPPRFVWEFPVGPCRDRIAKPLDVRALLPQVRTDVRVHALRLLNEDEKTVLKLVLESTTCRKPRSRKPRPISGRVALLPIKGYDEARTEVRKELITDLGLEPAGEDVIREAVAGIGGSVGSYSTKLRFDFSPGTRAHAAMREIHLQLLDTLEANVAGARADIDSEFLHDLRVATRRTRSALGQVKGVFPEAEVQHFRGQFGWIGQITGPTRDMDVYLLGFPRYRDSLPEDVRPDLQPLQDYLVEHQQAEQRLLAKRLGSPHLRKILKEWRDLLQRERPPEDLPPNAVRPIGDVAGARIYKIYKRVLRDGKGIGPETPAEALHELRKSCKKLRYLIEFFQHLYPGQAVGPLVRAIKLLLDNLGSFQDLEVQAHKLREFARRMLHEQRAGADTLLAMGMLVDGLLRRQQQARSEFAETFSAFAQPANRKAFRELFATAAREARTG